MAALDATGFISRGTAGDILSSLLHEPGVVRKYRQGTATTDTECAHHILDVIRKQDATESLQTIADLAVFAALNVAVSGYWAKLGVGALEEAVNALRQESYTDEQVVNLLLKAIPGEIPADVLGLAKSAIEQLVEDELKSLPGSCRAVAVKSESIFSKGGETVTCEFLVCAETSGSWLWKTVEEWEILGGCHLTCEKTVMFAAVAARTDMYPFLRLARALVAIAMYPPSSSFAPNRVIKDLSKGIIDVSN